MSTLTPAAPQSIPQASPGRMRARRGKSRMDPTRNNTAAGLAAACPTGRPSPVTRIAWASTPAFSHARCWPGRGGGGWMGS